MWWTSPSWSAIAIAGLAGMVLCELNLYLTTAVLHRGTTHGAITYPRWVERMIGIWLWATACTPVLTWVAAHQHHHVHADSEDDPHSPNKKGVWKVALLTWFYVTRWVRKNREFAEARYLRKFRNERVLHFLDRKWVAFLNFYLQIAASIAAGPAILAFWFSRIVPYMVLSGLVNAIGHSYGARRFDNLGTDAVTFWQRILGYLTGGETLGHNYHHRYVFSPTFRPGKFDPGLWFATRILRGVPSQPNTMEG